MTEVTEHGKFRVRKRVGIKKSVVNKLVSNAFNNGICHSNAIGSLKKYFYRLYKSNTSANNIRMFNHYVWIFSNDILITVFPLPNKFKNVCDKLNNERKEKTQKRAGRN